jgi:hypothetical protein
MKEGEGGVFVRVAVSLLATLFAAVSSAQSSPVDISNPDAIVSLNRPAADKAFPLLQNGRVPPLYVSPEDSETVGVAADAFMNDLKRVSGEQTRIISSAKLPRHEYVIVAGTLGHSALLDQLQSSGALDTRRVQGKWVGALVAVVDCPAPGIRKALIAAGSDRRGTAFASFSLSRQMGVSP